MRVCGPIMRRWPWGRGDHMLIINATFPDGSSQSFGKPEDLLRYMKEEGHMEVRVHAQYVFDTFANVFMTADEVERWINTKMEDRDGT